MAGGLEEEQEDIEVLELDFETAYEMIASGEIKDGKTIMFLQYAKINELLSCFFEPQKSQKSI